MILQVSGVKTSPFHRFTVSSLQAPFPWNNNQHFNPFFTLGFQKIRKKTLTNMRYHWSWLGFTVKTTNVLQVSPPFYRGWQKNRSKRPYQRPPPPRHTVESVPKLENLQDPKCSTKASETGTVVPVDSGVNIFGRALIPPTKKKGSMYIYI